MLTLNGLNKPQMGFGTLRKDMKMGDMEMIDEHGVKATFKDDGVHLDIVPLSECCEMCNDPRMIDMNGVKVCPLCSSINHIDYPHVNPIS
jgi:Zn finger protein HypA/HybF involved in hydrogenase expression